MSAVRRIEAPPFNSLFEMRLGVSLRLQDAFEVAFNSLFEMPAKTRYYVVTARGVMPFNSLFEMR